MTRASNAALTARAALTHALAGDRARLVRFIGLRLVLSLLTLWLLSVIVFAGGQLLPGDVGRAVLGPLADARAVTALNHQLGVDRPLLTQYGEWIVRLLHGDMGTSYAFRSAVGPFVGAALINSLKLGALAFVIVVPLGIAGASGPPCTRAVGSTA